MKRRSLYLIVMVPFFISCGMLKYNKVYSYDDEFRGDKKAYTRVRVRPDERRAEIGWARVVMEKQSGREIVRAYFVIDRSASSFGAGKTAYLKAGGKKFDLVIESPVSELRVKSEATLPGIVSADSSGVVSGQVAGMDTRTWIEEKFLISLGREEVEAFVLSGEAVFRFYFGPIPVTYVIRGRKLGAIKKVLT